MKLTTISVAVAATFVFAQSAQARGSIIAIIDIMPRIRPALFVARTW